MVLGLLAGGWLQAPERSRGKKFLGLVLVGLVLLGLGAGVGEMGWIPVIKRIWTPSWVLFSGGWAALLLAAFYALVDLPARHAWATPLLIIGSNSLAAYLIAHLTTEFLREALTRHLGQGCWQWTGAAVAPFWLGLAVLGLQCLALTWLYRRRIFLRI